MFFDFGISMQMPVFAINLKE
jgi:hypothetical protein